MKSPEHQDYLVDNSHQPHTSITTIHITEILAGIPWTTQRARQHIVNEIAQGLLKVLIFNNPHNTPFQKWSQGRWHAHWTPTADGEQLCTIFVTIAPPENKIKIRKGKQLKWKPSPPSIMELLTCETSETIQVVGEHISAWSEMTGLHQEGSSHPPQNHTTAAKKSFSAMLDKEVQSS